VPARVVAAAVLAVLALAPAAAADTADETALAERYAPVVRLVDQPEECGPGEPYEPLDVDVLFDEPTVALRGPWGGSDLIQVGPPAEDLARGLYEYHLDFPGNALQPGCDYERWARRVSEGTEPAVYAHVATDPGHPGRLALQYWLFYAYNDWNNLHEGDWEMIQLIFDAPDAAAALEAEPAEVGYSQHEGAERAEWGDDKLELVDGTHPVVRPAAGSHANFYEEGLFLGASASQGVGCDNTLGPTRDLRPAVHTIPSGEAEARAAFPWIEFEGRWGELQRAFYNGPTGPNLKDQWTEPIAWSEDWRDRSYAVPAGGVLGTGATDFFCEAIATGSSGLRRLVDDPLPVLALLAALVALVAYGLARATWRPTAPLRVVRRRAWGQILAAAGRMYVHRWPLFLGIGAVLVPVSMLAALLQTLVLGASSVLGIDTDGGSGGALVLAVFAIETVLALVGIALVQAVTTRALLELDAGRSVGPVEAYRLAIPRLGTVLGSLALAVVAVTLLTTSIVLIPLAVWLAVRWSLLVPAIELEGDGVFEALRRSSALVRGDWLKVASLTLAGAAIALVVGPLVGVLLILATDAPLGTANLVAGIVYALTIPYVALTTVYVYADVRVRAPEEAEEDGPERLPAELELGASR
jgi:hypothetical protein